MDNLQRKKNMKKILANKKKLMKKLRHYRGVTFRDYSLDFEDQESVRLVTEQFVVSKYRILDKPNED